jgi:hypothetical protein
LSYFNQIRDPCFPVQFLYLYEWVVFDKNNPLLHYAF